MDMYFWWDWFFDKKTKQLHQICENIEGISCDIFWNNNVYAVTEDFAGNLWFAAANGIYKYEEKTSEIKSYTLITEDGKTYNINSVYCITEDSEGRIWAGTADGLIVYNPAGDHFEYYPGKSFSSAGGPAREPVYSLYFDSQSVLWIGTSSGLYRYDRGNRSFIFTSELQELLINQVETILEDNNGWLWLNTNKGLVRFDPVTYKHVTFNLVMVFRIMNLTGEQHLKASREKCSSAVYRDWITSTLIL